MRHAFRHKPWSYPCQRWRPGLELCGTRRLFELRTASLRPRRRVVQTSPPRFGNPRCRNWSQVIQRWSYKCSTASRNFENRVRLTSFRSDVGAKQILDPRVGSRSDPANHRRWLWFWLSSPLRDSRLDTPWGNCSTRPGPSRQRACHRAAFKRRAKQVDISDPKKLTKEEQCCVIKYLVNTEQTFDFGREAASMFGLLSQHQLFVYSPWLKTHGKSLQSLQQCFMLPSSKIIRFFETKGFDLPCTA